VLTILSIGLNSRLESNDDERQNCPSTVVLDSMKRLNLVGQKFGRLHVTEFVGSEQNKTRWRVLCTCGNTKVVQGTHLTSGDTQSCGCLMKERLRKSRQLPVGEAARNHVLYAYRSGAERRGFQWDLTLDEFCDLTSSKCHYCGLPPSSRMGRSKSSYNGVFVYNGIDRKDNATGYVMSNVVPCCEVCNKAKRKMTYADFIAYLIRAGRKQMGM